MYIGIEYAAFRLNELFAKITQTPVNGSATQPLIVETDRRRNMSKSLKGGYITLFLFH